MQRKFYCILCICGLVFQPVAAWAWGKTGHRITGEIAQSLLTPSAQQGLVDVLGAEDLAEASTWPDFMRSSTDDYWQKTSKPFHYATIPVGKTYADVGAPPEGDAVSALEQFSETVSDEGATPADKQLALRFLIHIIGDLHQPLHVGNGEDRGGNNFKVRFFGETSNLHRIWDSQMIDFEQLSYSEYAKRLSRRLTPDIVQDWSVVDPVIWAEESAATRDIIYPDSPGANLSYRYIFESRDVYEKRLLQGGVRLAAYLNFLFEK